MAKKRTVWLRNARLEFGPWWWRWWLLLTTTGAAHHTLFGEPCVLYWSVLDEPITEEPPTPEVPRG